MRTFFTSLVGVTFLTMLLGCGGKHEEKTAVPVADRSNAATESAYMPKPTGEGAAAPEAPMATEPSSAPESESAPADLAMRDDSRAEGKESVSEESLPEPSEPKPGKKKPKPQIQAGTLTAGSLNDNKNLEDYRDYLSQAQQSGFGRNLPQFQLGERIWIEVKDAAGDGVPDAHITITHPGEVADDTEGVLLDTLTRADGRAVFSTGFDLPIPEDDATYELTVRVPGKEAIIQQVSAAQSPWVVNVDDHTRQLPQQLDLALVIDTTGSMGDELNYLKVEIDYIATTIARMYPNVDQRYSLIVYRDERDDYVVRNVVDFTGSLKEFREKLAEQSAGGGGDTPEAMHSALENATKLSWRRENTARVMFLVADAPPHRQHYDRTMTAIGDLRQKGVAIYPLAGSGPMQECEFLMRAAAFLTKGQYLFLTDHSGVGNPHAKPTAPKYEVEPLNQLMIRMIASELSGKEVLAKEIIATEENDGSDPPVPPEQNNQTAVDSAHSTLVHAEDSHHEAYADCGTQPCNQPLWEQTWFRITAGGVLIAGILLLDNRLRT